MKRILAMALSIALIATLAISGTIAYLTDNDDDTNVFTVGNVVIDQREWKRNGESITNDDRQSEWTIVRLDDKEGTNKKMPLYPAVITGQATNRVVTESGSAVNVPMVEQNFDNYLDKIVDVKNIGKSDAYIRTIVAIPTAGLEDITSAGNDWIHFNWNNQTKYGDETEWLLNEKIGVTVINGERYQLFEFTLQPVLVAQANDVDNDMAYISTPSLLGVWMDPGVDFVVEDKTDPSNIRGHYVYNGKTLEDISSLSILVASQACQSTGFYNAAIALNASFGATTITNHPFVTTTAPSTSVGTNEAGDTYYLNTKADLYWFADQVNNRGNSFAGKTVALTSDITFDSTDIWAPVGQVYDDNNTHGTAATFSGTFDGYGHTITGLNVVAGLDGADLDHERSYGFFGWINETSGAVIKNVKFDKATITAHHFAGVAVGYMCGTVSGVTVTNSTVTNTHLSDAACGDKAGAIVGFFIEDSDNNNMTNCSASNCTIKACRDAGQLVGAAKSNVVNNNSTADSVTVSAVTDKPSCCSMANHGKNIRAARVGRDLG